MTPVGHATSVTIAANPDRHADSVTYRTALITHAVTGKIDVRGVTIPAIGPVTGFR